MEQQRELIKISEKYAKSVGIKLNSDKKIVEGIIKGLLRNKKEKGELYCPCRRVTGNKEEDKKIICPCIFHLDEIKENGKCHCGLFVK
ncbi:MAG: ferredoxin-thioredoxin reductase catalytic domain-containing protein [Candidatus Nanoarchaeia archaeon]|nr:ferredoxin-thioredoxin reductase catalytic domain-containing protein [Candidatus Nanoarchaeia archaeon]MDD5741607.1 ferredoxin-thioredoxin reductase catalytic domain-containing protein [Candidatus Nanoarchaeia archaeon]